MKIKILDEHGVSMVLSRRNLEELLEALNRGVRANIFKIERCQDGGRIMGVYAEENDVHYERVQKELE